MSAYQIGVIVGSLRRESFNQKLATAIVHLAPAEFSFTRIQISDLPLYNQDDDQNQAPSVLRMKDEISRKDGLLFVTPEYNRSIPGVLKNALDQGSRPYDQNCWAGKPAGIIGVSTGSAGTSMAQQHLRNVLSFLDVAVLRQPEAYIQNRDGLFADDGTIGERSRPFIQNWMDHYVEWIKKNASCSR